MNDRYLFRAKRIDNGEWVTGYYTKSIVNGSVFGYIRESIFGTDIKIMLNTLCQYTGLTDKNGNPFVEGETYDLDIFFCDRRTTMSNVRINTNMYIQQNTGISRTKDTSYVGEGDRYNICYEEYMKMCFCMLDMCEAIFMLKGWSKSCGANREYGYALAKVMIIMFE